MSGKARNCRTWSSFRQTPRSSYCAQLPLAEATISPSPVRSHTQPRASKYCSSTSIGRPSSRSSVSTSSVSLGALGLGSRLGLRRGLAFERSHAGLQRFVLVTRGDSHGLHRLKLVAADEIHAADPFAHLFPRRGFCFAAHSGDRPGNAVHHANKVVEHLVFGLHFLTSEQAQVHCVGTR